MEVEADVLGHRAFGELLKTQSPERRVRNAEVTKRLLKAIALHELGQAHGEA